jgi:hypothetical protein
LQIGDEKLQKMARWIAKQERMPWGARLETEKEIGKKVSVEKNYLDWGDSKLKLL